MTQVKICGIKTPAALEASVSAGVRFLGFVFYPPSPRHVSFDTAFHLAKTVPTGVRSVGLFVNPGDETLERIVTGVQLDMIQLHGDESPARVVEIKARYNIDVMKAIPVATPEDLTQISAYEDVADWLLFDTKSESDMPGGTGQSFDWALLSGRDFKRPWMLAGGINDTNVNGALSVLRPSAIDVSSGVESAPGVKDVNKIKSFIKQVKSNG